MSRIKSVLSTTAVLVGSGMALLTGGIAKAEPAPPAVPVPSVPGLSMIQQFIDPAKAPQLLQNAASILTGVAAPAAPAAPPPLASAALNMPQQQPAPAAPASLLPGILPATTPATATAPAAGLAPAGIAPAAGLAPAAGPASTVPSADFTLPQVPGLPVPLPQHLSLPGDLTSLLPGAAPSMTAAQAAAAAAGAPAASAPSVAPALASLFPTNALP